VNTKTYTVVGKSVSLPLTSDQSDIHSEKPASIVVARNLKRTLMFKFKKKLGRIRIPVIFISLHNSVNVITFFTKLGSTKADV